MATLELFDEAGADRGFYSDRNRLNDLTGREWVFATKSVINKPYPPNLCHRLRSRHGGQKPPQLCADLVQTFTKCGERVLDPLMGVGGTLLGAALSDRDAVGIELDPRWIEIYREVCKIESLREFPVFEGDCRAVLPGLPDDEYHFVLTDVPYWHMDKASRSPGKFKRVGEPARENPRKTKLKPFNGRQPQSKAEWLEEMRQVFELCRPKIKPRRYLAVFVGDMYYQGRYHRLSDELAQVIEGLGYVLKANLIWYDVSKSLHVYGYRYAFIPSIIHQNILVFRKE